MVKMIVLDLDGTLLNDKEEISETTIRVINKISENSIIVLASARGYYRIRNYFEMLGLEKGNNYIVGYNGCTINKNNHCLCFEEYLDSILVRDVSKSFDYDKSIRTLIYTSKMSADTECIFDLEAFMEFNKIYKIVFLCSGSEIHDVKKILFDKYGNSFEITSSVSNRVELVPKGVSKLRAIKMIASHYGIKQNEIIAVGDGENDIEMISYAGYGIAMKNAGRLLKEQADIITEEDNNNDGLAKALLKLCNIETINNDRMNENNE